MIFLLGFWGPGPWAQGPREGYGGAGSMGPYGTGGDGLYGLVLLVIVRAHMGDGGDGRTGGRPKIGPIWAKITEQRMDEAFRGQALSIWAVVFRCTGENGRSGLVPDVPHSGWPWLAINQLKNIEDEFPFE